MLEVVLKFKEGWYGYANTPANIAGGWVPTKVDVHFPDELMKMGTPLIPEAHPKSDGAMVYNGDSVSFRQQFAATRKKKDGTLVPPGEYTIEVTIQYQTCNEEMCLPPVTKKVEIKVNYDK